MIDPRPITLESHDVRLEPLERQHSDALHAAALDGDVWKLWYVAVSGLAPGTDDAFVDTAVRGQEAGHMLAWVVRELRSGTVIGTTRSPSTASIMTGGVLLSANAARNSVWPG